MTYITPKYGIQVPSPSTQLNQLGLQLQQMGTSIEEVLDSFDYNGADPDLVLSRVAVLEAWCAGLEASKALVGRLRGTQAQRLATTPQQGMTWQDTDGSKHLWSVSPTNQWRRHEGQVTVAAGAWATHTAPVYARTIDVTLPTGIGTDESLMITTVELPSTYSFVNLASILTRNPTTTQVRLRHIQFYVATLSSPTFNWQVTKAT